MKLFQILFDEYISFSLPIKKQPLIIFLPKKQWFYDYFYEFASEALHYGIFGCGVFRDTKLERCLAKKQLYSNKITKFWELEKWLTVKSWASFY